MLISDWSSDVCSSDLVWQSMLELLLADCQNFLGQSDQALESVERAGTLIESYGTQLVRGAYLCLSGDALAGSDQRGRAIACWQQAIVESRRDRKSTRLNSSH